MADISIIARLVNGFQRNVDLSANALVVGSIKIGSSSPVEITKVIAAKLLLINAAADADGTFDTRYTKISDLVSVASGKGASLVGIQDAGNYFPGVTIEAALQQLGAAVGSGAATGITYNNATSGLAATTVQGAIDEVEARVDSAQSRLTATETVANAAIPTVQKGAANGVATLDASGLIPITQMPPAALERLVIVANQAARFALTLSTVQNGDTVLQSDTNIMYFVKDDTNLGNAGGYAVYTAGTASAVAFSGITGLPTTLVGYGITDYAAAAKAAAVADAIVDGVVDVAPSQNAVFDALALKAPIASPTFTGTVSGITKTMVGLSNVDNTADAVKAVASANALITAEVANEALSANVVYAMRFSRAADVGFVAGRMSKADVDSTSVDNFDVIGLCRPSGAVSAGGAISLVSQGDLVSTAHGLVVGEPIWLTAAGLITQTAPSGAVFSAVVKLGTVKDANTLRIKVQIMSAG